MTACSSRKILCPQLIVDRVASDIAKMACLAASGGTVRTDPDARARDNDSEYVRRSTRVSNLHLTAILYLTGHEIIKRDRVTVMLT